MLSRSCRNIGRRNQNRRPAFAGLAVFASATAGVLLFALPVLGGTSSASYAAFTAAKASAMLSVGDVFPASEYSAEQSEQSDLISDENISVDKPATGLPKESRSALFTVDDSEMLSWGELE
ncbi:MAG: hypothetical protein K2J72_00685, partial [Oscillospiraceae bacterium]|nr:hypothetical protein [Oscillospiraceae bacterium]